MNRRTLFARSLFSFLTFFFIFGYLTTLQAKISFFTPLVSLLFTATLLFLFIGVELLLKKTTLLNFNTISLGLFFGYLMGKVLFLTASQFLSVFPLSLYPEIQTLIELTLLLLGLYLGLVTTLKASHEIYVSIPFIKFTPNLQNAKEILLDPSALSDTRLLELAHSGLLDDRLVIPRFVLKELYELEEAKDEVLQSKAKVSLELLRKLESIPDLHLRYSDTDFSEIKESFHKILRLARLLNANVLTADIQRAQMASLQGIRLISLHVISNALKPLMQRGEYLNIKIQRQGKEERQGVGYLEDGTMIVVNGGGDFIGKSIRACVLSVKQTTTGRMIFCNVSDDCSI